MALKCSIVVPTYNEEKYIKNLLESVKKQTVAPVEVILVDASSDKTREIATKYGAKVVNQDVRRVSWARMRGFQEATGDIIISSDADTILADNYVEQVTSAFSKPGIAAIFGPVYLHDGPALFKFFSRTLFSIFLRFSVLIRRPNLNGMNFACTKEAYTKSGGFDPEMVTAEDVYLGAKLQKIGKIKYNSGVKVYTSARRITGMGGWKFIWHHSKNFVKMALGGKSSGDFEAFR